MADLQLKNIYKRSAGGVTAVSDFSIDIAVLSFAEIAPNTQFETLGTIEIPEL